MYLSFSDYKEASQKVSRKSAMINYVENVAGRDKGRWAEEKYAELEIFIKHCVIWKVAVFGISDFTDESGSFNLYNLCVCQDWASC